MGYDDTEKMSRLLPVTGGIACVAFCANCIVSDFAAFYPTYDFPPSAREKGIFFAHGQSIIAAFSPYLRPSKRNNPSKMV